MKEIGGYIEFESYHGTLFHEGALGLNCGRNCLAYLIEARGIKRIKLPYFLCSSVKDVCARYGVDTTFYHIDSAFRPVGDLALADDEWLYIVNYYGQLTNDEAAAYKIGNEPQTEKAAGGGKKIKNAGLSINVHDGMR